jgi:nitrate/TMAO reductase-like tetraheme cytochrome c subunit
LTGSPLALQKNEVIMNRIRSSLRNFFFPPAGAPRWVRVLPYGVLGVVTLALLVSGAYAWDYTNSPSFCGTSCHTMPPEYAAYQLSPHSRVACVECHIGREFIGNQIFRKAGDIKHIVSLAFHDYEFPITADDLRPARETCERCHSPQKFSDDSLREIKHFGDDVDNTPISIYLILKTGGGSKRQGLGLGIHWHIENRILYYPTDKTEQTIPYVRVYNDDGTVDEYTDLTANVDPATIPEDKLKEMDCITCHNRITHNIYTPESSMDRAMARGAIDLTIPEIRLKGVEVLQASYVTQREALDAIAALDVYYQVTYPDYYASNREPLETAIAAIQQIYAQSVFPEQKANWDTHPNNVGHKDSPGCFRCHDGKHLNTNQEAIRLECNLCHSIPVVAGAQDFVVNIEISRGPEPESHKNSNWIAIHRQALDQTCALCHDTANPGGTDNSSFCSNSACHGSVWTYAGLDAPKLAEVIAAQLPTPEPTPTAAATTAASAADKPTFEANIKPIFEGTCGVCHGQSAAAGLNLLTYEAAMKGGKDGAVIVPGDSAGSKLVEAQGKKHFGNLTETELTLVKQWIDNGAPEK